MGLLPGIDKTDDNLNINARKRATNRSKTNTKTKTISKGRGLDADLGLATNLLAGGWFDIYVDLEGWSSDKSSPRQDKSAF